MKSITKFLAKYTPLSERVWFSIIFASIFLLMVWIHSEFFRGESLLFDAVYTIALVAAVVVFLFNATDTELSDIKQQLSDLSEDLRDKIKKD